VKECYSKGYVKLEKIETCKYYFVSSDDLFVFAFSADEADIGETILHLPKVGPQVEPGVHSENV
jgi:hypothetical protein